MRNNKKSTKGSFVQAIPEVLKDTKGQPVLDQYGRKIRTGKMKFIRHTR